MPSKPTTMVLPPVGACALAGAFAGGVEKIVEFELDKGEQEMFAKSVASVKGLVDACKTIAPELAK